MGPTGRAPSATGMTEVVTSRPAIIILDAHRAGVTESIDRLLATTYDPVWSLLWSGYRPAVREMHDVSGVARLHDAGVVAAVLLVLAPGDRHGELRTRELRAVLPSVPLVVLCDASPSVRSELIGWGADDVVGPDSVPDGLVGVLAAEVRRSRRHSLERMVSTHLLTDVLFRDSGYAILDEAGIISLTSLRSAEPWFGGLIGVRASDLIVLADVARFEEARRLAGRFPSVVRTTTVEVVSPSAGRRFLEISLVDIGQVSAVRGVVATHRQRPDPQLVANVSPPSSSVIECLAEGVVVYRPDGVVTVWNSAAARLLGVRMEDAVGAQVGSLVGHVPAQGAAVDGTRSWVDEVEIVLPDGSDHVIERTFTHLRGSRDVPSETVLVVASVSGRRSADVVAQRFAAILDSSSEAILSKTSQGIITTWNAAAERMYGYTEAEVVGRHVAMLVPEDRRPELEAVLARVAGGQVVERMETVRRRKDGSEAMVLLSVSPLFDESRGVVGAITVTHDITEQRAAEAEREVAELRFEGAFRRSTFGMAMADLVGRLTYVNPALCELLGLPPDRMVGHQLSDFAYSEARPAEGGGIPSVRVEVDSYTDERRYHTADGVTLWLQANVTLIRGPDGEPLYLMVQALDISARKRMEYELEHRALHDDLTGLPNRALLNDRLDQALAVAGRSGHHIGVVFLDLDGFKNVNDALGHATGDSLLVELGHRLDATIRPDDTVARFGGDEFVILCADVTIGSMELLARRIGVALTERFEVGGNEVEIHASMGITVSASESSVQSLLSEADAAMFRAKELGRNRAEVFDDTLRARAAEFLEGEKALRLAIARRQMVAHYQPIVDLASGRPIGVEALVRWIREDGTIIGPASFVPLAEATGLIVRLGELVLLESTQAVAAWNGTSDSDEQLWVSVNLSARQLGEPSLVDTVRNALDSSGLLPHQLHLEITETVVMGDIEASVVKLEEIRALGVRLSIDDFGTGYSSLAYLKQLPVDTLKIDRSFVDGVTTDPDDRTIVEAVIGLSRALGLTSLAEGVETAAQHDALVGLGCELGQGYLWARPMPAEDAREWMGLRFADAHGFPGTSTGPAAHRPTGPPAHRPTGPTG